MKPSFPSAFRIPSRAALAALACALALAVALPPAIARHGALAVEADAPGEVAALRAKARELDGQGNRAEAFALFTKILAAPQGGAEVAQDLRFAVNDLRSLNRESEVDALLESAAAKQAKNQAVLLEAGRIYVGGVSNHGAVISGKFERGYYRGGAAKYVGSFARDRVRALQLTRAAIALGDAPEAWREMAGLLMDVNQGDGAWQLQIGRAHV